MKQLLSFTAVLFFLALACGGQAKSSQPTPNSLGFTALCDRADQSTTAQWDKQFDSLKGQRVHWSGKVTEVFESEGAYLVWLDAGRGLSGKDIHLTGLSADAALALEKGQLVRFSGDLDFFSPTCVAALVNASLD